MHSSVRESRYKTESPALALLCTTFDGRFLFLSSIRNSVSVAEKPQGIIANVATNEGLPEAIHPPQARFRQRPDLVQTLRGCCQIAGFATGAVTGETYKTGNHSPTYDCPPTFRDRFLSQATLQGYQRNGHNSGRFHLERSLVGK